MDVDSSSCPLHTDLTQQAPARSGDLTQSEWVEMAKSPEEADTNGDKRISVEEYARWQMKMAD